MFWTKAIPNEHFNDEQLRRRFEIVEMPEAAVLLASVTHILASGLGYRVSAERGACMLGSGLAIPMMSYSMVEYLLGIDISSFDLLELGGGGSTRFWAGCAKTVLVFEPNGELVESLRSQGLPNVDARLSTVASLVNDMQSLGRSFDAIVIDSAANRFQAAQCAVGMLSPGGFIILDNSDWYPNAARALREADLIQVDFHDFRPLHHYRCTTSLFMHRDFRPKPRFARLPLVPIGGKDVAATNSWDAPPKD